MIIVTIVRNCQSNVRAICNSIAAWFVGWFALLARRENNGIAGPIIPFRYTDYTRVAIQTSMQIVNLAS